MNDRSPQSVLIYCSGASFYINLQSSILDKYSIAILLFIEESLGFVLFMAVS